jgi:hypothetical protein
MEKTGGLIMAVNERVQWNINDLYYGQLAPSQANREDYYPGKRPQDVREGDANWGRDYRVPVGLEEFEQNGPLEVERVRVIKLGRNTVSDQTIAAPITGTPQTIIIDDDATWGTGADPEYTITPTDTQDVDGEQERTAGYDWAKGLE